MDKTTFWLHALATIVGGIGQAIWAVVFWSSPLLVHHWTIAYIGVGIVLYAFARKIYKDFLTP